MKTRIFLLLFSIITSLAAAANPPLEEGKQIFASRCAACHNINKTITGPALAGIEERRTLDWIYKFVHSSQSLIKSGDKDAIAIFEQFNKIPMPDHTDLTEENVKSIVEYIKSESSSATEAAPFAKPGKLRPAYTPLHYTNYGFFLSFLVVVVLMIGGMLMAVKVKELQRNMRGEE